MSKYDKLWEYVEEQEGDELVLTFDEIGAIIRSSTIRKSSCPMAGKWARCP